MSDVTGSLQGKVVWLTGASSGIGAALAVALSAAGCRLALTARRAALLEELQSQLAAGGASAAAFPADVTDRAHVRSTAGEISSRLGPVDLLIANAGSYIPTDVRRFNCEEYEATFRLNLFGALNCIEAVLPEMISRRSGHIAAVSSVAGYRALPRAAAYGASKAALSHFLNSLRFDLEPYGVAVSVISPGFVRTPLTDKNDFPMPFIIDAPIAAERIVRGLAGRQLEIHFPRRFSLLLKALGLLPYPLYHRIIRRYVLRG